MSNKTNRIAFHNALLEVLKDSSDPTKHLTENLYFQPPENVIIKYPAIVYSRYDMKLTKASNLAYLQGTYYQVTVLDKDPDSEIVDRISHFPTAKYSKHFATSGINHDVFIIYFK